MSYFFLVQERWLYNDGHAYDADVYFQMAQQVFENNNFRGEKPFIYRVATPYLVGIFFPQDVMLGFTWVNGCFGVFSVILLYCLFKSYRLTTTTSLILLLLYICNPNAPFRFSVFYPAFTDPGAFVFILMIWLYYQRVSINLQHSFFIGLLTFIGTLFREIVVIMPCVFLLSECINKFYFKKRAIHLELLIPLGLGVLAIVMTHEMVTPYGEYGFIAHAMTIIIRNLSSPDIVLLALIYGMGPVIFLFLIVGLKGRLSGFLRENNVIALYLVLIFGLAVVAGNHTDRFIFWSYPALLLSLGYIFDHNLIGLPSIKSKLAFYLPLIGVQAITHYIFVSIPIVDFGGFQPPIEPIGLFFIAFGDPTNFGQLVAPAMTSHARVVVLLQFFGLCIYLWAVVQKYADKR